MKDGLIKFRAPRDLVDGMEKMALRRRRQPADFMRLVLEDLIQAEEDMLTKKAKPPIPALAVPS